MGAAYESFVYATSTTSSSVTIGKPSGTASGDLLIAYVASGVGGATYTSSGWTQAEDGAQYTLLWKIAGGSEPADYTFSGASALGNNRGYIVRFSNAHASVPIDDSDSTEGTGSNLSTSVTISHDDTTLVAFFIRPAGGDTGLAVPSGMTQRDLVTANPAHAFATETGINTGASPATRQWTNGSGGNTRTAALVAIRTGSTEYDENPADAATATDASARSVGKPAADAATASDAAVRSPNKKPADSTTATDAITGKAVSKGLADSAPAFDQADKSFLKNAADSVGTAEDSIRSIGPGAVDSVDPADELRFDVLKQLADSPTAIDDFTAILGVLRSVNEVSEPIDQVSKAIVPGTKAETVAATDLVEILVGLNIDDSVTAEDAAELVVSYLRQVNDLVGIADQPSKHLTLTFSDSIGTVSDWPITNPTRQIAGTVIDHETGAVVEGATLRLFRTNDDQIIAVTLSAADGSYSFERDADDPHTYYVTADYSVGTPIHGVTDRGLVPEEA